MTTSALTLDRNGDAIVPPARVACEPARGRFRRCSALVAGLFASWITWPAVAARAFVDESVPSTPAGITVSFPVPVLQPFLKPPEIGTHPAGSLVLCGGGRIPERLRDDFIRLMGGKKQLVVIPTGSDTCDDPDERKEHLKIWESFPLASLEILHTRSRDVANSEQFVAPLRRATGVWIAGGRQTLIAAAYSGTLVERELHEVIKRGGVIGGTSAGAACLSRIMIVRGDVYNVPGFGLLPGTIVDQHFVKRDRKSRLIAALVKHPAWLGVGIDENTALVVRGTVIRCVGDSTVSLCLPPAAGGDVHELVLKPGDTADLNEWRRKAGQREVTP